MSRRSRNPSGARKTVVSDIAEDIKCTDAMLRVWQRRADPEVHAGKLREIDEKIAVLQDQRAETVEQHRQAAVEVARYEKLLAGKRRGLTAEQNRKDIDKMKELVSRLLLLRETDPEQAAALEEMLRGAKLA